MAERPAAGTHWKHLTIYGLILVVVGVVGAVAIWSFVLRQSLVIQPDPLPKVTLVTRDPSSPLAASWIQLLTRAEMSPTLVPFETFDPIEGVVVFCDVPDIPPRLAEVLDEFVHRGGALVFVGRPPSTPIGKFRLLFENGRTSGGIRLGENDSPVLARLNPAYEIDSGPASVPLLKESPRMRVDARWKDNARAVVMHMEMEGGRYLWMGLDPAALGKDDNQLMLLLRTAFRWVAGQPVSDGAIGTPQVARTLSTTARREARGNRLVFSVDRTRKPDVFTVRMGNRGGATVANPTVKVWLPPRTTEVALGGNFIMNRGAVLSGVPEDGACLVSLPSLTRNEERVLSLKIVSVRPPIGRGEQQRAEK